ncbi:hypothetical protein Cyrtocomes_00763 [Candidatus Cyrtobacter comes]|uniref:Uncharacterized protein n=1 Tax=Candidatus Cyrtobacter comes TaxID=675776 RepID=A0ABU5L973_9RICK|nr:hypothetical protein [Candidatus Cyrtobacter comes]MDZ5762384.1 hypothetical protein [Candidatus Cyrtobacter comes]
MLNTVVSMKDIENTAYSELTQQIKLMEGFAKRTSSYAGDLLGVDVRYELFLIKSHIEKAKNSFMSALSDSEAEQKIMKLLDDDNLISKRLFKIIMGAQIDSKEISAELNSTEALNCVLHFMCTNKHTNNKLSDLSDVSNSGDDISNSGDDANNSVYNFNSTEAKDLFYRFLEYAIGNQELNTKLIELEKSQSLFEKEIYHDSIKSLKRLSYKSRHFDYITENFEKFSNIYTTLMDGGGYIEYKNRISIDEYGKLLDIIEAERVLEEIKKYTIISSDISEPVYIELKKLTALETICKNANELVNELEKHFLKFKKEKLEVGDIIVHDIQNKLTVENREPNKEEKEILAIRERYDHSAILNKEKKLSHILGNYREDEFVSKKIIFSDIFRIDIEKLLNKEILKKAQKTFSDDDLNEKVNQIYKESYDEIDKDSFEYTKNSDTKRKEAGMNSYSLKNNRLSKDALNRDSVFHKPSTKIQKKFKDIHKGFFGIDGELPDQMICSEFTAKIVLSCLIQTNIKLCSEFELKSGKNAITIPFTDTKQLDLMMPDQLIDSLKRAGCVERVPNSDMQKKFFKRPEKDLCVIVSGMARKFNASLFKSMDISSSEMCKELLDAFLEEHNKQFPHDKIELNRDIKSNIINDIESIVDKTIHKVKQLNLIEINRPDTKIERDTIIHSITEITQRIYEFIKNIKYTILTVINKELCIDMREAAEIIINNIEKPSKMWASKVSNDMEQDRHGGLKIS